jgi:hypothetical protein
MLKYSHFALIFLIALLGCEKNTHIIKLTQQFNSTTPIGLPDATISQNFMLDGIMQTQNHDAGAVCENKGGVAYIITTTSSQDDVTAIATNAYILPISLQVYCLHTQNTAHKQIQQYLQNGKLLK